MVLQVLATGLLCCVHITAAGMKQCLQPFQVAQAAELIEEKTSMCALTGLVPSPSSLMRVEETSGDRVRVGAHSSQH